MKFFFLTRLLPVLILLLALSATAWAQSNNGGPEPTATTAPFGEVSMLLAGGVAYGFRQLRNRRQKS